MGWLYLIIAGLFEVCFALALKYSENFSRLLPTVLFIISSLLSYFFLSLSLKTIPVGTAYAIWTGIGAFGIAVLGIIFFREGTDFWRIFFICTLIISIIGLKITS
ncbi:MAG: multidrug efflux SMR transporter [Ignavibacteria bacterium]|nr:multidrug efflux SMR transporter [Ignavibacteria bacterium]